MRFASIWSNRSDEIGANNEDTEMTTYHKAALAGTLAAALSAGAGAQTVEWKFSHWVPAAHPLQKIYTNWAKTIEHKTNGTLKISIFPAQQLGKAPIVSRAAIRQVPDH